ncbi:MAG: hypothetical protein F6J89_12500 [Symploca sp. SIO1C4]|uniref:DNA-directed DNA polymerase n=1 Tax=Symploca sp. SIO1C4 TaxID=2607765 RepID=A0A6B3NA90_9CYAN|nr:hypothetical protein [Symploca sp. SIO1C4]
MFYSKADTYQYSQPIVSISEALLRTSRIYCPLDIDTEFTHLPYDLNRPKKEVSKTITVQIKEIASSEGKIYTHPDCADIAKHPVASYGFMTIDHLVAAGHRCVLTRVNQPTMLPVIQFDLYGFFLTAELYRIVQGAYRDDIDELVRSKNPKLGQIQMGRRLIASTLFTGNKREPWVYLPWVLEIDGHKLQVALSFYDTCAVHGAVNYATFCANCGVKLKYKDTFTAEEKKVMIKMYLEYLKRYGDYSLGDLYNHDALIENMEKFRIIYRSLNIENYFELPRLTIGATVARIVRSKLLQFLGFDAKGKNQVIEFCRYGTAEHFKEYKRTTAVYNAKVDGGRCRNNRPNVARSKQLIADADIAGCYGNGLRNQEYPLGRPITVDYPLRSNINEYLTLRQFLKKYRKELVPGLWQARVSTPDDYLLKYSQDFLVSWHPPKNPANIPTDSELENTDWFTEDNIGTTKIYSKQVNLAIIQADFLDWLDNTCTARQRKELLDKLHIVTAVFYPKSERCTTIPEFLKALRKHKGKNITEAKIKRGQSKVIKIEQECHAWISVNMGDLLVNQLLAARSKYSKKDPEQKPMNDLYKLCINTIYGDMVSPFFDIGNVVVGNNITARARAMAWYMEKGLNGFQTITDGCAFEVNRVISPRNQQRLTSESVFEIYTKEVKGYFNITPLGSEQEIKHYLYRDGESSQVGLIIDDEKLDNQQSLSWLGEQITIHLQKQFPNIPVIDKFQFEIKDIYTSASFHGTANYKFWIGDTDKKAKMRSYKKLGYDAYQLPGDDLQLLTSNYTPSEEFLRDLRNKPEKVERCKTYLFNKILKPGEYKKNYETSWKNSEAFPGCTVESARLLRECSLTQFTFQSKKQFDSWEREQKRLRDKTGQSYESWFINDTGSLDFQEMIETLDEMIRRGDVKYASSREASKHWNLSREYSDHPEYKCLLKAKHQLDIRYGRAQMEDLKEAAEAPIEVVRGD